MTTELQTVSLDIHDCRHAEAQQMLAKLMKKAARYGMDLNPEWTGLWERRVKKGENIYKESIWEFQSLRTLTISTPLLRAGDYELVAKVEGTPNGNFVDTVPGVEFDDGDLLQFRTADSYCDHCKTARQRKHVFVVRDVNTGTLVQVGRTCLQDFLGINPTWALARFTWLPELLGLDEEDMRGYWSSNSRPVYDLAEIIQVGVQSSRIFGWCSKGMANIDETKTPTVMDFWLLRARVQKEKLSSKDLARLARLDEDVREEDQAEAAKIIAWVRGLKNPGNDYLHNLTVVMAEDSLMSNRVGLAISAVSAYARAHEAELNTQDKTPAWVAQKELDAKSRHQGELKERLRDLPVTIKMIREMGQSAYNWDAINYLVKFQDADGNIFTWFTSADLFDYQEGQAVTVTGTVKGHKEYQDIQETQLTRCQLAA
jgi:hypothetical protein